MRKTKAVVFSLVRRRSMLEILSHVLSTDAASRHKGENVLSSRLNVHDIASFRKAVGELLQVVTTERGHVGDLAAVILRQALRNANNNNPELLYNGAADAGSDELAYTVMCKLLECITSDAIDRESNIRVSKKYQTKLAVVIAETICLAPYPKLYVQYVNTMGKALAELIKTSNALGVQGSLIAVSRLTLEHFANMEKQGESVDIQKRKLSSMVSALSDVIISSLEFHVSDVCGNSYHYIQNAFRSITRVCKLASILGQVTANENESIISKETLAGWYRALVFLLSQCTHTMNRISGPTEGGRISADDFSTLVSYQCELLRAIDSISSLVTYEEATFKHLLNNLSAFAAINMNDNVVIKDGYDSDSGDVTNLEAYCCISFQLLNKCPTHLFYNENDTTGEKSLDNLFAILISLCKINERLYDLFISEPNQFVADSYDMSAGTYSARHAAVDLLDSIIDKMVPQTFTRHILEFFEKMVSTLKISQLESILWLIGNTMSPARDNTSDEDIILLPESHKLVLINACYSSVNMNTKDSPLILARLLWAMSLNDWITSQGYSKGAINLAMTHIANSGYLPVQIFSCRLIGKIFQDCKSGYIPVDVNVELLIRKTVDILPNTDVDTLHVILETLRVLLNFPALDCTKLPFLQSLPKHLIFLWNNNGHADPLIRDELTKLVNELIDKNTLNMEKDMVACLQQELSKHWHDSASLLSLYTGIIDTFASTSETVNRCGQQFASYFCEQILLGSIDFSKDTYSDAVVACFRVHWCFLSDKPILIAHAVAKLYERMRNEIDRHIPTVIDICTDLLLYHPVQQNLEALKLGASLCSEVEFCANMGTFHDSKIVRVLARMVVLQRNIDFLPSSYVPPLVKRMVAVGSNYCIFALGTLSPPLLCDKSLDRETRFQILVEFIRFSQQKTLNEPVSSSAGSDLGDNLLVSDDLNGVFLWDTIEENAEDNDAFTEEENCSVVLRETTIEIDRVLKQFVLLYENEYQRAYEYIIAT